MSVSVLCPSCGGKILAPSQLLGRMAKCPQCGQTVKVIQTTPSHAPCEPQDQHPESGPTPSTASRTEETHSSARPRLRYGLLLWGSALTVVALLIGVLWLGRFGALFKRVDLAAKHADSDPVVNAAGTARFELDKSPEGKEAAWTDASKGPVQHGDVRVELAAVTVRNIKLKDPLGEESVPATKYLTISIHLVNMNATHKIDFLGWSAMESPAAVLQDDSGKRYQRLCRGPGGEILGQARTAISLDPGKPLEDLLVFEPPMNEIRFLRLDLPATAFGDTGSLRFQIPKELILH